MLQTVPEKSLVLIEEPETSLHPSAQHEFGRYLVEVACNRGHQIMLTTHSEFLLRALPSESLVYLGRAGGAIEVIAGLTSLQARSLMAEGHVKALHVLVEDDCAKAVLRELLRRGDRSLLDSTGVYAAGDADTLRTTVRTPAQTGLPVAAVRDADQVEEPSENIFRLPGSGPPEKEIFGSPSVKAYVRSEYGLDLDDVRAGFVGVNHHDWFRRLAERVSQSEVALVSELSRAYVRGLPESEVVRLLDLVREASR
jgi:hypothetical protein